MLSFTTKWRLVMICGILVIGVLRPYLLLVRQSDREVPDIVWTALQASKQQDKATTSTTDLVPSEQRSSLIHCVGDNFLPSAWIYRSCQYRNLCWDDNQWKLYPSQRSKELNDLWLGNNNNQYDHHQDSYRRCSTSWNQTLVSPIATSTFAIRKRKYTWTPTISWDASETMPIRLETNHDNNSSAIGVLIYIQPPFSPMTLDLLVRVLLPIYNLLGMFGWHNETTSIQIYVLNPNDCTKECQTWLRMALEDFMGYQLVVDLPKQSFCLARAASGMGILSGDGLSMNGYDAKDYLPQRAAHNAGRGGTLWEFRRAILTKKRKQGSNFVDKPMTNNVHAVVAIPSKNQRHLLQAIQAALRNVESLSLQTLDDISEGEPHDRVDQLLQAALRANVWITIANDGASTWPAFFMPRGSTLLLLYNASEIPKRSQQIVSDHAAYPYFGFWNHVSHLQVHWAAIPEDKEGDMQVLLSLLQEMIPPHKNKQSQNDVNTKESSGKVVFNGEHKVTLHRQSPLVSKVHCIGENWEWDSPNYRSCHIQNLCLDLQTKQFQIGPESPIPTKEGDHLATRSIHDPAVMMGQTIRMGSADPWFPRKQSIMSDNNFSFYSLPSDLVWLPFYAQVPNANNPGHLLWDYFLPLYTLVELFWDPNGDKRILLTNLDTDCVPTNPKDNCYNLTVKFLPLLGAGHSLINVQHSYLDPPPASLPGDSINASQFVCANHAAIGIGMLTDHGVKKHGQLLEDYRNVRNAGRGMAFWRFRQFMLRNIERTTKTTVHDHSFTITFSVNSSNNPSRRKNFGSHIQLLKSRYPSVTIQSIELSRLALQEQIQVIQSSNIFVTVIGGSASTAMFLDRNSCLILYYNDIDDFVKEHHKPTTMPSMLDWDFWNHASYLRVHWLPLSTMDQDLHLFSKLIETEIASHRQW